MKVIDLAHFTLKGFGMELDDPTPYVSYLWSTFDAMIKLMEPQNMANFMEELLPQMMNAMPSFMRTAMKAMVKVPGGKFMIEKMAPVLFPLMMPGILPKVLPDMLKGVEKRVPMPEFMKKQMPDLMPGVMENLMPKMLPQVLPYFIPKMIEFLKNAKRVSDSSGSSGAKKAA